MEKYLAILRAIHAGRKVSKADLTYFTEFHGGDKFDSSTYEKLKTKLSSAEGLTSFSDEDWNQYLNEVKNRLTSDPAYREQTLQLAQDAAAGKTASTVQNGLNVLLAGSDILTSLGQVQQSNQRLAQVQRPGRPPVLQRDMMLQQALANAHAGTLDQSTAIAPAQLANLDQFRADLAAATTASTGNAGAYGAYAQVAANRRDRANLGLVPLANDVKRQEQARETQLLGLKLGENQAINQSIAQNYPLDIYQYGLDRQAANELGQIGRYNLRNSMTGFAGSLVPIAEQASRNRYNDLYNKMLPYGHDNAQIAAEAGHMTNNLWSGAPVVNQNDYEQSYGADVYGPPS